MSDEEHRDGWLAIDTPASLPQSIARQLVSGCRSLEAIASSSAVNHKKLTEWRQSLLSHLLPAAPESIPGRVWVSVISDLVAQGWKLRVCDGGVEIRAPDPVTSDSTAEKARVRAGHLLERDRLLRDERTRRFVREMESSRLFKGQWHSIASLFRDGRELAAQLRNARTNPTSDLQSIIDPYIQVIGPDSTCDFTGLRLMDVWRYFRLTWSTVPANAPGRRMLVLIRDRAAANHPVIGIAALASSVVQSSERDTWIGWTSQKAVEYVRENTTTTTARWLLQHLDEALQDVYIDDLLRTRVISKGDLSAPTASTIEHLRKLAKDQRAAHERHARSTPYKSATSDPDSSDWQRQAETYLFRSKRCIALANLLEVRRVFVKYGLTSPDPRALDALSGTNEGRKAISGVIRSIKSRRVGIDMADITTCGSIAPYNHLLGGKLVALLLASPEIVAAYRQRYARSISIIASAVAGRPIRRSPSLVLLCTTSLYGIASSQYNRLVVPAAALGQSDMDLSYRCLGRTEGFGSYHFSQATVEEMDVLVQQRRSGRRVNNIFGEGVNPKLRKIREALAEAGLPSDALLRHRSPRLIYGIALASNFKQVLLGRARRPSWLVHSETPQSGTKALADYWQDRWLRRRIQQDAVLRQLEEHSVLRPLRHGAQVRLSRDEAALPLFAGLSGASTGEG